MQKIHPNPEKPLDIPWEAETFGKSAAIITELRERRAESFGFRAGWIANERNPDITLDEALALWQNDKPPYRIE